MSKAQKPNIICILTDDLGYGDLSCQGGEDILTPNIDNIANQGILFKQFYANCPVCSPSRASLLTGKYPDLVGVPGVVRQNEDNCWGYLSEDAVLLPELLRKEGYHTGIIGKWHLGYEAPNTPNARGFDYFKGFLGDMMDDYWTHLRGGVNWMRYNDSVITPKGHATDIFTNWAIEYLSLRKEDEKPFFLCLAYNAPHFPIQPPEEYLKKVQSREKGISIERAKNVALIEHLDFSVGRLMSYLESSGLIENTLVFFTSDNGGSLAYSQSNGKLRGGKQQMFEGGIKVPAMAMWKNKIKPGTVASNVSILMDLFPTFYEVAVGEVPGEIDGVSILGDLLGTLPKKENRYLFWVRREGGIYGGQAYYGARYGNYKILQNSAYEPFQFYDIKSDECEQHELQDTNDKHYKMLRKALQRHISLSGQVPWQKKRPRQ
ncbi:sulfatase-like hydrolase/transferase [Maribellus maritimus]|nr:sulfatase-like hydrolase/transferase [Maribellus maritimus]